MLEYIAFGLFINREIRVIGYIVLIFFSEDVEKGFFLSRTTIESPPYRFSAFIVILLIVGEDHQLGDIEEPTKIRLTHSVVDSLFFGNDSQVVVRFLYLNKGQGEPIDKTSNIGTERLISTFVSAGEFCGEVPYIVRRIVKINELNTTID